jgi:hypothetical protein
MSSFLLTESLKSHIALLSSSILTSPELNTEPDEAHPTKLSKLEQLLDYTNVDYCVYVKVGGGVGGDNDNANTTTVTNGINGVNTSNYKSQKKKTPLQIRQLSLLSLSHIFTTINPSYRITLHNSSEVVNKELRKTRQYENRLIKFYQRYLKICNYNLGGEGGGRGAVDANTTDTNTTTTSSSSSTTKMSSKDADKIRLTTHKALCNICVKSPCFNFSTQILQRIITTESRNNSSVNPDLSELTLATLRELFLKETDDSVECVKCICKEITNKLKINKRVSVVLLKALTLVPLRIHEDESIAVKAHLTATKKQLKRKNDADREAEEDARLSNATGSKLDLAVAQGVMLESITTTYFRLLRARDKHTLPTVLRGITKITPLLNIDAVVDVLKEYEQIVHMLDPVSQIELCNASLKMGRSTNNELSNDSAWIVKALYNSSQVVDSATFDDYYTSATGLSLLNAMNDSLVKRRELSKTVVGSFVKRLVVISSTISAYDSPLALSLVQLARVLLARYAFATINLENEEFAPSGLYDGACEDPDKANPYDGAGGIYWEAATLQHSHHPEIAKAARSMSTGARLSMPQDDVEKSWRREKDKERDLRFPMREPKKEKKGFIHSDKWVKTPTEGSRKKMRKLCI